MFFLYFCIINSSMMIMKKILSVALLAGLAVVLIACGSKKKNEDIIAPRIVKVQPKAPIRMQSYNDSDRAVRGDL